MSTIIVSAGIGGGAPRGTPDGGSGSAEVTLIEAGPDYPEPDERTRRRCSDVDGMSVEGYDWGLQAYLVERAESRAPQPYLRGRVVGGSSSINAAIAQRATVEDINVVASPTATSEWGWDDVQPYFRTARERPRLRRAPGPWRGGAGGDQAPSAARRVSAAVRAFEQTLASSAATRACEDFNELGTRPASARRRGTRSDVDRASSLVDVPCARRASGPT